ncbi:MAG: AAA family ATPase [bacterium]
MWRSSSTTWTAFSPRKSHTFYLACEGPLPRARGKTVKTDITILERLVLPLEDRPVLRGYEEYRDLPEDARVRLTRPSPVDHVTIFAVNMVTMFPRTLQPPSTSFFLFGPRGTGKSTWIRSTFDRAFVVNLLAPENTVRYERDSAIFRAEVLARPKTDWIVVDEVQRVPRLLDEVQYLMEEKGYRRFALTGSSARKLKRGSANLLAGRAVLRRLFPLTVAEMDFSVPLEQLLRYGSMPLSVLAGEDLAREDYLRAFVTTYLVEEVRAEGLVRDLGGFSRFLAVAALAAAQTTNVSGLARDAEVSRETVRGYFEILVDTLIGEWLPAYRPRAKVKEVARPKFYWFDAGVLHAAAGGFDQPLSADWDGVLLEHLVMHELRAYLQYGGVKGSLGYWATPSGAEVDFVWWRGATSVAIEVKSGRRYRREYRSGIRSFEDSMKGKVTSYVVYRGDAELEVEGTRVLPLGAFLRRLHRGDIVG